MNLTLNTHPCKCTIRHQVSPQGFNQSNRVVRSLESNIVSRSISNPSCPSMFFGNCMQGDKEDSIQNQIIENGNQVQLTQKQKVTNKSPRKSSSRKKISLSLRQSQVQFKTPKKYSLNTSKQKDSTNKKLRTCEGKQSTHKLQNIKILGMSHGTKIKTEPATVPKKGLVNVNQMRESLKPSTNISTNIATPAKKPDNYSSQKVKLTITNNFKSQIQHFDKQHISQKYEEKSKKNHDQGSEEDVFIEESFMTAKLANIYGQINHSHEANFPNSNIVYYNQIMAHESLWKAPPSFHQQEPSKPMILQKQIHFFKDNPSILKDLSAYESFFNDRNSNIKDMQQYRNDRKSLINDQQQKPQLNIKQQKEMFGNESQQLSLQNQSESNFKSRFKERKFIGEYAKTIKTFNESELRSDHESVVLEHIHFGQGLQEYFPSVSFNRGSIKEQNYISGEGDNFKRQYNSFGGEQQNQQSSQLERCRFRQYISNPIEQSSLDSEKQN